MKTPKVSIIVPVYDVEPYIEDCVRSIMAQDYQGELECILIDDRGSDKSIDVAKKSLSGYSGPIEFRIIQHERNKGLSGARNTGLNESTGDYCCFLDSDDELTPDCISLLVKPLASQTVDMVIGDYTVTGSDKAFKHLRLNDGLYEGHSAIIRAYNEYKWPQIAVAKLYNMDFLRSYNLFFAEGIIHEDELWSGELACLLRSVYVVNKPIYIYKVRSGSITTTNDYEHRKNAYRRILPSFLDFLKKNDLNKDAGSLQIINRLISQFFTITKELQPSYRRECYLTIRKMLDIPSKDLCSSSNGLRQALLQSHYLFPPSIGFYLYDFFDRFYHFKTSISRVLRKGRK